MTGCRMVKCDWLNVRSVIVINLYYFNQWHYFITDMPKSILFFSIFRIHCDCILCFMPRLLSSKSLRPQCNVTFHLAVFVKHTLRNTVTYNTAVFISVFGTSLMRWRVQQSILRWRCSLTLAKYLRCNNLQSCWADSIFTTDYSRCSSDQVRFSCAKKHTTGVDCTEPSQEDAVL